MSKNYVIQTNSIRTIGYRVAYPGPEDVQLSVQGDISDPDYVAGYVYNKDGKKINHASVYLIWNATDKPLDPNSKPFVLTDGSYSAWTDLGTYDVSILFQAKGYKPLKVQFYKLMQNADVVLEKGEEDFPYIALVLVVAGVAIYSAKTKKVSGFDVSDAIGISLIIGGVIGFDLIKRILESLGIWGGKKADAEAEDPNSPFKPDYWRQFTTYTYTINEQQGNDFAYTIYNAFTLFQDNYNAIKNVFNQMRTKANVSFLAYCFQKQYGEDLLSFLQDGGGILPWDGLSNSHMDTIISLVKNLPKN